MQVGDLIRHKKHGAGLVVKITKSALEINGRTHHYEIQWLRGDSNPANSLQWRDNLEVISGS